MSVFGAVRSLAYLGAQVAQACATPPWFAAADALWAAATRPRDGADRLADLEAEQEAWEPGDCGLGGDPFALSDADIQLHILHEQGTTNALLQDVRNLLYQAFSSPTDAGPIPPGSTRYPGFTRSNTEILKNPAAVNEWVLRQRIDEDRDPSK